MIRYCLAVSLTLTCACPSGRADDRPAPGPPASLRVAAVQMRSGRELAPNVARIRGEIAKQAKAGARVVVFPECALTGYFEDVVKATPASALAEAERAVGEACREARVYAVVGSPWRVDDKLYNSALVFGPDGSVIERYHKVQLAEPWPTPGDHLSLFHVDGVPCSVIICHDERYPELVRLPVLAGAKVVFYVSHESGVREEAKVGPYRAQIQARAVENNVFIVHSNAPANRDTTGSHGQSRVIAPDGNLMGEAGIFGEEAVVADLELRRATRDNALKSVSRGPLGDWWREGVKRVRVIGPR
ncbi:MAG: carbon-nitrogen hydrolase family protein [Isosphaeraceae bacterium]